jgi:hypothetical protein
MQRAEVLRSEISLIDPALLAVREDIFESLYPVNEEYFAAWEYEAKIV